MKWNTDWLAKQQQGRRSRGTKNSTHEKRPNADNVPAPLLKKREEESKLLREIKRKREALLAKTIEEHDNARRFIQTLQLYEENDDIAMLARGVIDLEVGELAKELECKTLPVEVRWLLVEITNAIVGRANKEAYGHAMDDEIPWMMPESFMTTLNELKQELELK